MNALSLWAGDSATMLRRQLRRRLRQPQMTVLLLGEPIVLLLLFVYVFGSTLGAGLGDLSGGRAAYVDYVTPGILLLTVAFVALATLISLAIHDRGHHRPVPHHGDLPRLGLDRPRPRRHDPDHVQRRRRRRRRAAHRLPAHRRTPRMGRRDRRPSDGYLGAHLAGRRARPRQRQRRGRQQHPLPLVFLPFLGSGFVPTDTMPAGVRLFAEYQPFTSVIETVRGLLMGTEIGNSAWLAVAWCVVITLVGFFWSRALFNRDPSR